ncbi:MAG: small basic protein [Phycisphaerales bacterium]
MSLDRSLKVTANLAGKRSVLTRTERIAKMQADKKFDPKKDKVLGIAKTLVGKG